MKDYVIGWNPHSKTAVVYSSEQQAKLMEANYVVVSETSEEAARKRVEDAAREEVKKQ